MENLTTATRVSKQLMAGAKTSCQICTIPQGNQPATWWKVDYTGPFHILEKGVVCPHGNSYYDGFRFASIIRAPILFSMHFQNTLFIIIVPHTISLQTPKLILQQMKCGRGNRTKVFTGPALFPSPRSRWPNGAVDCSLLEAAVSAKQHPVGLGCVLSCRYMICFKPTKGGKRERPLKLYLIIH